MKFDSDTLREVDCDDGCKEARWIAADEIDSLEFKLQVAVRTLEVCARVCPKHIHEAKVRATGALEIIRLMP